MRRSRRFPARLVALATIAVFLGVAWLARAPILTTVGDLVVEETPAARSDAIVAMSSRPIGVAEAAELYRSGFAPRVVVLAPSRGADERILDGLGLRIPGVAEQAVLVLSRLGVPPDAIQVHADVDGTNSGVRATARWAQRAGARRLIVVADRSHSRRVATLLRAQSPDTTIVMRSSRHDAFDPTRWWRQRGMTRELAMEGLRWINSVVVGDLWEAREAP